MRAILSIFFSIFFTTTALAGSGIYGMLDNETPRVFCESQSAIVQVTKGSTRSALISNSGLVLAGCTIKPIVIGSDLVGRGFVKTKSGDWALIQKFRKPDGKHEFAVDPLQDRVGGDEPPNTYSFLYWWKK